MAAEDKQKEQRRFPTLRDVPRKLLMSEYFVLYLTIVYFLVIWAFVPWMGNLRNLSNILSNMWPLLAVAIGQTFVLIVAGIDLSQTSIMAVTSVASVSLITTAVNPILFEKAPLWGSILTENGGILAGSPLGFPIAIVVLIVIGVAIGLINGISVGVFRMPAFIVTMISMMGFSAVAIFLTKSENIMNTPVAFNAISEKPLGVISYSLFIAAGLAVVAHIILSKSIIGRWMYAVGINERTAKVSGVPTTKVIVFAYAFSGFCAAIGSLLYSTRLQGGRPVMGGLSLIMNIVGANIIGGMSLTGGRGKITWTVFGVLFFVILENSLSQMNLNSFIVNAVKGAVILAAALLDVTRTRFFKAEV